MATPFDCNAPLGDRRAIIRRNPDDSQEIEMVEAMWGSNPRFAAGASFGFIRSEGQAFPSYRCLIPASEFIVRDGKKQYRVTLDTGNFFYLAGVWEPPMAGWPLSYRVITVDANHEVSLYQERHGAIIQRRQVMQWLDATAADDELLVTPPPRIFVIQEIGAKPVQTKLAL
ncbi:SOS response-associated peptidase family protein [Sphingomonas crocodyli]|uniref:SOS response-associated peptidase family protein n=1 Tax=Sphingomonas crocodyli TaxID=1979270 RepID=UPI001F0CC5AD|nr:SOS response-associated peptidase family protein [Sphingomonas crocodyli]